MVATIKQMLQNISGDCVRINIMVGEQGSSKASSYTDIKVHLIIYAFKYPDKPWVGTLQGGIKLSSNICTGWAGEFDQPAELVIDNHKLMFLYLNNMRAGR